MVTIQYIKYEEIKNLNSHDRVKRILDYMKEEKIILLEGKLRPQEETELIAATMSEIDKKFKGIEIAAVNAEDSSTTALFTKIKQQLINMLLGDRQGMTIIGPATVVKEIKQDPNKIELLFVEKKNKRK